MTTQRMDHWLRSNESNRYPRRIICMDSEAHIAPNDAGERHTFRLACASFDVVQSGTFETRQSELRDFLDPKVLWEWVDSKTTPRNRTVLWAHNLGYDLRLTQAFLILPTLGWHLRSVCLNNRSCWARWAKNRSSLVMVDSSSFLPRSLSRIGAEVGIQKPPLPKREGSLQDWFDRCRTDVRITRAAVLRILQWMEENECGTFRLTGASQASAMFRHRFLRSKSLLVHANDDALEAERRASWTGRCEVWKHGPTHETVHEWDYQLAYATIAARAPLPVQLTGSRSRLDLDDWRHLRKRGLRILSEASVKTTVPVVPTSANERILWPVGEFETVLWDDELAMALGEGAEVKLGKSFLYIGRPVLQDWAEWVINRLEGTDPEPDELARIVLKGWSRSLIGRFGLRHPRWSEFGRSPIHDLLYLPFLDIDRRQRGVMFQVGEDLLQQAEMHDSGDAIPAVMSAVMSAARVRLWHTMRAVGLDNVFYVDTDSLLVSQSARTRLEKITALPEFAGLRLKSTYYGAEFRAPRNITLGTEHRVAGLPKSARVVGLSRYVAEHWQSVTQSLMERVASTVHIRSRSFEFTDDDFRRAHLDDGSTTAYLYGAVL